MNILKAFSKQLFGAKYERMIKSLIACLILFLAVRTAEIRVEIAPRGLFLTAAALSAGIMRQALHSSGNADSMTGLFMMPFVNGKMIFSLVLAFAGYTLITKTLFILAFVFAVCEWSPLQITVSLLCACNGCLMAAAWYTAAGKTKKLPAVFFWSGVMFLSIFFVRETVVLAVITLTSLLFFILSLFTGDAYVFYRPASAKRLTRRGKGTGSIFLYLLRYLATNKNYLLNTVCLCVIACILPHILGQFDKLNVMPLGFAVLCLNTPVCILLSCDPDLEQAVRVLPGQAVRFCTRYCLFIFSVNMTVNSVYLAGWQIRYGGVSGMEAAAAFLIALLSAALSVLLEWFYPVRNWKIENDLWHHPRKYIVPLIMLLIAGLIGVRPV